MFSNWVKVCLQVALSTKCTGDFGGCEMNQLVPKCSQTTIFSSFIVTSVLPTMLEGLFFLGMRLFGMFLTMVSLCVNPCLAKADIMNSSVGSVTPFTLTITNNIARSRTI